MAEAEAAGGRASVAPRIVYVPVAEQKCLT